RRILHDRADGGLRFLAELVERAVDGAVGGDDVRVDPLAVDVAVQVVCGGGGGGGGGRGVHVLVCHAAQCRDGPGFGVRTRANAEAQLMSADQVGAGAWHHERMMKMRSGPEPARSSTPGRDFPRHSTPCGNSPGRMVALVGVIALAATLAPIAIAAGMSASKGDGAKVVETVRAVTLGGGDAAFEATF